MRNLRESPTRDFMEILTTVNREVSSRIASKVQITSILMTVRLWVRDRELSQVAQTCGKRIFLFFGDYLEIRWKYILNVWFATWCDRMDPVLQNRESLKPCDGMIRRMKPKCLLTVIKKKKDKMILLEGLWHGQKWLHSFVDSEAYHEQMGPTPSSNGSLDIALSNAHT